jgi:hypothetical protein
VTDWQQVATRGAGRPWPGQRPVIAIAAVLALVVTTVMVAKLRCGDFKDAEVWYDAGRRVLSAGSLTGLRSYRYPPAFAVMIAPLCALPFPAFFLIWYGLNLGLFLLSLRLAVDLISPGVRWNELPRYWLPTALVVTFALDNLFLGQTNILVMLLVYWAWWEVARNREWRAGPPLALAIAVKVFPAPLIAYFLYRWRLRAAAASLLSCLFFFLLLPAPVRGFRRNLDEVADWGQRVVMPYLSHGRAGDWGQHALDFGNQSLQAVAHRFLTPVNAYVMARRPVQAMYVNRADLTEDQINRVVLALFAALGLSFLAACGWRRPVDPIQQATEYSLATILLLLVSALSWTYFFVMMLLPVATALHLLANPRRLRPSSRWALRLGLWIFALAVVLVAVPYARALGNLLWASLLLYGALALACWDLRHQPAYPSSPSSFAMVPPNTSS